MTRALTWWLNRPCELRTAVAGILLPYVIFGFMVWITH